MNPAPTCGFSFLFPAQTWDHLDPVPLEPIPYPGFRPPGSWRLKADGHLHGLSPAGGLWRDRATGELLNLGDRHLVLRYASNLDPGKLLEKLLAVDGGEVFAIRAAAFGWVRHGATLGACKEAAWPPLSRTWTASRYTPYLR